MTRPALTVIVSFACAFLLTGAVQAQGRGPTEWMTSNGDAQRSSWIRTDAKISKETMQKPGFQFLWKLKLKNDPKQLNSLTQPILLDLLIGYRGFRALGFVAGSSDNIFVIDTDLGRMEWQKHFPSDSGKAGAGTIDCPGGLTANVTRPTITAIPSLPAGSGGTSGGRRSPARSAVGEPGQGAVTLAQVAPAAPPPPSTPARPNPPRPAAPAMPSIFGSGPFLVYGLSGDGMLHTMHISNGADAEPPMKFLPPNASAHGLIVIDNVAYVVTENGCGDAPNGVWALDLASKEVTTWKANIAGTAGPAFGPDGTLYVGTGAGGEAPFSLVALEPKTLKVKGRYSAGEQEFTSSPVIFEYKGKIMIAATTKDGRIHLLDSASLSPEGGAGQPGASFKSPVYSKAASAVTGALASWQSADGTRWLLAPITGPVAPDAGFTVASSSVMKGAIVAWKVVERNGAPALEPGWVSRDLVSPLPPTIINGVVFATSSGEFRTGNGRITAAQRVQRSKRAVLYALDAATGKELWNSGATMTSFARGGAVSGGGGQIYLGTYDGTLYAFGFPMEH